MENTLLVIATFGLLIVTYMMVRGQARTNRMSRTYDQISRIENRDFRRIREFVEQTWDGKPEDEHTEVLLDYSNALDIMGYLYLHGYLDKNLLIDLYGTHFVRCHIKLAQPNGFMQRRQRERGEPREQIYHYRMVNDMNEQLTSKYHYTYETEKHPFDCGK